MLKLIDGDDKYQPDKNIAVLTSRTQALSNSLLWGFILIIYLLFDIFLLIQKLVLLEDMAFFFWMS